MWLLILDKYPKYLDKNMIIKLAIFFFNFSFKNFHFPKLIKQKMIYKKYWLKSNTCRISLTYILLLFQIVKPDFVNHDIMLSLNISNFIKMHVSYRSRLSNILSPPALDDFFQNPISWGVSLLPSSVVPNVFDLNMKHLVRT